uniref:Alternative protein FYCO1 n=1 Tax=Homo sapiens TaxID=9606 RepID=L8E8T2_HUMAN|nr:alternative protein FYCO1 [Homo sapiens]
MTAPACINFLINLSISCNLIRKRRPPSWATRRTTGITSVPAWPR